VVWLRGSRTGLEFDYPITTAEVTAVQRPGAVLHGRGAHPAQRRGGLGFSEMR